jgi:hypothetical protein
MNLFKNYYNINLEKVTTDPLYLIAITTIMMFLYIYFINNFYCQLIGLVYPTYHAYQFMSATSRKLEDMKSILKYFTLYSHMELITCLSSLINLPMLHFKFFVYSILIYFLKFQTTSLDDLYARVIHYDKVLLQQCHQQLSQQSPVNKVLSLSRQEVINYVFPYNQQNSIFDEEPQSRLASERKTVVPKRCKSTNLDTLTEDITDLDSLKLTNLDTLTEDIDDLDSLIKTLDKSKFNNSNSKTSVKNKGMTEIAPARGKIVTL